jgi:hypothetical protein
MTLGAVPILPALDRIGAPGRLAAFAVLLAAVAAAAAAVGAATGGSDRPAPAPAPAHSPASPHSGMVQP